MRLHTEQSYSWRSKFLTSTCMHARTYVSMWGNVTRACMAHKILVQLSTDTDNFEKILKKSYETHACHLHACFKFKLSCTVSVETASNASIIISRKTKFSVLRYVLVLYLSYLKQLFTNLFLFSF